MNLKELDEYRITDVIKFHNELNPALFDGEHLKKDVEEALLKIADDFIEYLGLNDLHVSDITLSGSNAAYSYTPNSDIDLHLIVDFSKLPDSEVYSELFNSKKTLYNDTHTITVKGYDVELYVQDSNEKHHSLGEYSVKKNKWIKFPIRRRANLDQSSTLLKFKKLIQMCELALRSKDMKKVDQVLKKLKKYRQAGLDKHGEFGPENLSYKLLKHKGIVDQLYKHANKLHSDALSVDEDYDPNGPPPGPEFKPTMPQGTVRVDVSDVYDWYKLGQHISNLHGLGHHDFGKGPPSTIMSFGSEDEEHKYIKNLEKTGLTTTDIDPVDPKQPKGMKRQKVDPTFNVNEKKNKLYDLHKYQLCLEDIENRFGVIELGSGHHKSVQKLLNFMMKHNISPDVYGNIVNEKIERLTNKKRINESIEDKELEKLFYKFQQCPGSESVIVGEKKCLLLLEAMDTGISKNIHLSGFKTLDEVQSVSDKFITFKNFGTYPKVPVLQTKIWRQIKLFDTTEQLEKCLMFFALLGDSYGDWKINLDQIDETSLNESASGYIPSNAERNDPRFKTQLIVDPTFNVNEEKTNHNAIVLTNLPKYFKKDDPLEKFVPERSNVTYALHPEKYEATFYSLTNKDIDKLKYYRPKMVDIPPGTLVGDMALANKFYRATNDLDKKLYARLYKESLKPYPVDLSNYRMPELLIPKTISESASGYIPSNAERNDPRFKTGLTVDVHPDSIKKNASKLGLGKIKRSGVPPLARSDGKIK